MTTGTPAAPTGLPLAAAQPGPPGAFGFDIHLQGDQETVFFDV